MGPSLTTPDWPSRRALVWVWLAAAVGFGVLLGLARVARGPLDDPNPALQRPGFLDLGALPEPAPHVGSIPSPGRRAVVFFERPARLHDLCQALARRPLTASADVAVVVPEGDASCPATRLVADPEGALAHGYGMRRPREGGPPAGYAVVDSRGAIRYRTLDPSAARELDEVATILGAVP